MPFKWPKNKPEEFDDATIHEILEVVKSSKDECIELRALMGAIGLNRENEDDVHFFYWYMKEIERMGQLESTHKPQPPCNERDGFGFSFTRTFDVINGVYYSLPK